MQRLPRAKGKTILNKLLILGIDGALANLGAAVALVVKEGMARGGHVYANLVGASGFQAAFHHGNKAKTLQHPPVRYGPFPLVRVVVHAEPQAVVRVPAYGAGNGAFVFRNVAPHHGRIHPVDRMDKELVCQVELRRRVFRYYQQAAGIFVYPVYQHAHALVLHVRRQMQVVGEGVHQRAVVVPVSGMHHHAGGLVHHQHVVVFIDNVQGNVFRENLRAAALVRHHKLYNVARAHNVVGFYHFVVHQHVAQLDGLLHAVAGSVFLVGGNEFVYPERLLPFVYQKAEVLEHFVRGGRFLDFARGDRSVYHWTGTLRGSSVR